ncbi:hypothetical protein QJS66_19185 [Kocuria rhizophila]|nr:hypothetical protein QJS66_19185 [Kocuria rhizophila]
MFNVLAGCAPPWRSWGLREGRLRERAGTSTWTLLSSALSSLVNQTTGYAACGNDPAHRRHRPPSLFPTALPTADKDLIITVGDNPGSGASSRCWACPELGKTPLRHRGEAGRPPGRAAPAAQQRRSPRTPPGRGPPGSGRGPPVRPHPQHPRGRGVHAFPGPGARGRGGQRQEAVPLIKNPVTSAAPRCADRGPARPRRGQHGGHRLARSRRTAHDDAPHQTARPPGAVPTAAHDDAAGSPDAARTARHPCRTRIPRRSEATHRLPATERTRDGELLRDPTFFLLDQELSAETALRDRVQAYGRKRTCPPSTRRGRPGAPPCPCSRASRTWASSGHVH